MSFTRMIPFFLVLLLSTSVQANFDRVIYGEDNRKDLHEVSDQVWLEKASSTVAIIATKKLSQLRSDDSYTIKTSHYGQSYKLCPSENFFDQQRAASCSGSLIDKDIVMTAGHCFKSKEDCGRMSFVFDFAYHNQRQLPESYPKENVYSCKNIIHSQYRGSDFALIRLDRKVTGRTPLEIRHQGIVSDTDEMTVIGHPAGLPTKVTDQGQIRKNSKKEQFTTNLDTYGGNSGSAVFNSRTGLVEGILVRGARDFVMKGRCRVSNVCKDDYCRGEDVTRVSEILPYLDQENEL